MTETTRKCPYCEHTRAAHPDGVHCALCRCRSEEPEVVQETLAFRSAITMRRQVTARKR